MNNIHLHKYDLPDNIQFEHSIAVDTETTGLCIQRDRLCLVQICGIDGTVHLVQVNKQYSAVNLRKVLANNNILKIFHYARFDVAMLYHHLGVFCEPIYCTKVASKIARTNSRYHGLRELCRELAGTDIFKQQQCSNWNCDRLTKEQLNYAAGDVLHLHKIKDRLDEMLEASERTEICNTFMQKLPEIIRLDLFDEKFRSIGWDREYIFSHNS